MIENPVGSVRLGEYGRKDLYYIYEMIWGANGSRQKRNTFYFYPEGL